MARRAKTACYLLGPAVLTGAHVDGATALLSETTGDWDVNLHFNNDDFINRVAKPYVNRQIAIVVGDVVESAPTINGDSSAGT